MKHGEHLWELERTFLDPVQQPSHAFDENAPQAFPFRFVRVTLTIEIEREDDGRWIAEVPALPGVMCYGQDRDEAVARVQALALRVIADRLEHREAPAELLNVSFKAA